MNPALAIAAVLSCILAVVHSWVGEKAIVQPVLALDDLPRLRGSRRAMQNILRFAWHLTSVYFVAMGALLFYYSGNPKDAAVLTVIALTYFISAVLTFGASRGRHLAWPVFTIVGLIAWFSRN